MAYHNSTSRDPTGLVLDEAATVCRAEPHFVTTMAGVGGIRPRGAATREKEGKEADVRNVGALDELLGKDSGSGLVQCGGSLTKLTVGEGLGDAELVGLYFSAHWCPPCKGFTPVLAEWYKRLQAAGRKLEIVFVSSDNSAAEFAEYAREMPWKAIPYEDQRMRYNLGKVFSVSGIPTLVFLTPNGDVMTDAGRSVVISDKDGHGWPWRGVKGPALGGLFSSPQGWMMIALVVYMLWRFWSNSSA